MIGSDYSSSDSSGDYQDEYSLDYSVASSVDSLYKSSIDNTNPLEIKILKQWRIKWFNLLTNVGKIPPNDLLCHNNMIDEIAQEYKEPKKAKLTNDFDNLVNLELSRLLSIIENATLRPTLDWYCISGNPNISFQYMIANKNFPWDWKRSINKSDFDANAILTNMDILWDFEYMSNCSEISIRFILSNPNLPWNWHTISRYRYIGLKILIHNPNLPWDWYAMTNNLCLTERVILKYIDESWNWATLYNLFNLTENIKLQNILQTRFVEKLPTLFASDDGSYVASSSRYLTTDILLNYVDFPWIWTYVTANKNIPFDFIKTHFNLLKWSLPDIVRRNDFNISIVVEHLNVQWDWRKISEIASFEQIEKYPKIPWNWNYICMRAYREEQDEHVQTQLLKYLLLSVLNYYEDEQPTQQSFNYELADYVFANSYLVKFMVNY
jgi:hypothetical protein